LVNLFELYDDARTCQCQTITETKTFTELPLNVCQTVRTHIPEGTTISYDNRYFKTQYLPAVYMQCIQIQSGPITNNSTATNTVKPEAATAVIELLMMGVRTPETC
jgi:hypothetical protein